MEKYFPGFYNSNKLDFDELLDSSSIILDTNVLLDIYRIKRSRAEEFLSILKNENIVDKLWIPYDVAWLYHKEVNREIIHQVEHINSVLSHFTQSMIGIENCKQYPYFEVDTIAKLKDWIGQIETESQKQKTELSESLKDSDIKRAINELYSKGDKIGTPYSDPELDKIYEDALMRYSNFTPPDNFEADVSNKRICHHDLVVWKQVLAYAKDKERKKLRLILFVTSKINHGWYYIVDKKVISPRHELLDEFYKEVNSGDNKDLLYFHCCTTWQFIELVTKKYTTISGLNDLKEQFIEDYSGCSIESNDLDNNQVIGTNNTTI